MVLGILFSQLDSLMLSMLQLLMQMVEMMMVKRRMKLMTTMRMMFRCCLLLNLPTLRGRGMMMKRTRTVTMMMMKMWQHSRSHPRSIIDFYYIYQCSCSVSGFHVLEAGKPPQFRQKNDGQFLGIQLSHEQRTYQGKKKRIVCWVEMCLVQKVVSVFSLLPFTQSRYSIKYSNGSYQRFTARSCARCWCCWLVKELAGAWRERVGTFSIFFCFSKSSSLLRVLFWWEKKEKACKNTCRQFFLSYDENDSYRSNLVPIVVMTWLGHKLLLLRGIIPISASHLF